MKKILSALLLCFYAFISMLPVAAQYSARGAQPGANSDITSLTGLTTPLTASQGGTGLPILLFTGAFARKPFLNYWEPGSSTGRTVGVAGTNTGSFATFTDSSGSGITFTSAASADAAAGLATGYIVSPRNVGPIYCAAIKPGRIANVRIACGFGSADTLVTSSSPALHDAYFYYDDSVHGTVFWRVVTNNGGTPTSFTTTIPVATTSKYLFVIDCTDSTKVDFYCAVDNGPLTLIKSQTATLPTASTTIRSYAGLSSRDGTASAISLYFYGVSVL